MTLRVGSLEEGATSLDHEATWLVGHNAQITFGELWAYEGDLYVEAALHVPCRHLEVGHGRARCRAHRFTGPVPRGPRRQEQPLQLGGDRFVLVHNRKNAVKTIPPHRRGLPVLENGAGRSGEPNPCLSAPCRTADNVRGSACCRDLQIEIMCTKRQRKLEALVRSRRSPYLCKIDREGGFSIEAEMISTCGYLEPDGVACSLHGRSREDGRPAKPDLCSEWPPKGKGLHPGCVFGPQRQQRRRGRRDSRPSVQI